MSSILPETDTDAAIISGPANTRDEITQDLETGDYHLKYHDNAGNACKCRADLCVVCLHHQGGSRRIRSNGTGCLLIEANSQAEPKRPRNGNFTQRYFHFVCLEAMEIDILKYMSQCEQRSLPVPIRDWIKHGGKTFDFDFYDKMKSAGNSGCITGNQDGHMIVPHAITYNKGELVQRDLSDVILGTCGAPHLVGQLSRFDKMHILEIATPFRLPPEYQKDN
ncbi:hypothetical protein F5Y15DRAFT_414677 [Xylariaceae sp. FL0016]|nr:hypothetical protein F5Y15DRAFT_414677 [Xylariaceae sp. FL0016]